MKAQPEHFQFRVSKEVEERVREEGGLRRIGESFALYALLGARLLKSDAGRARLRQLREELSDPESERDEHAGRGRPKILEGESKGTAVRRYPQLVDAVEEAENLLGDGVSVAIRVLVQAGLESQEDPSSVVFRGRGTVGQRSGQFQFRVSKDLEEQVSEGGGHRRIGERFALYALLGAKLLKSDAGRERLRQLREEPSNTESAGEGRPKSLERKSKITAVRRYPQLVDAVEEVENLLGDGVSVAIRVLVQAGLESQEDPSSVAHLLAFPW